MTTQAESTDLIALAEPEAPDLMIRRAPEIVLAEAQRAAVALQQVIAKKTRKVMFQGKQYLEACDWALIGKFYGVTAKVISSSFVEYGEARGFEARAVVVRIQDGQEISAADSMCLDDEATWKKKPLFQLRSMAQTRACAKALRNVLMDVPELAGFATTPAEEMEPESRRSASYVGRESTLQAAGAKITIPEANRLGATWRKTGHADSEAQAWLREMYGIERRQDIRRADFDAILQRIQDPMPLALDYAETPESESAPEPSVS